MEAHAPPQTLRRACVQTCTKAHDTTEQQSCVHTCARRHTHTHAGACMLGPGDLRTSTENRHQPETPAKPWTPPGKTDSSPTLRARALPPFCPRTPAPRHPRLHPGQSPGPGSSHSYCFSRRRTGAGLVPGVPSPAHLAACLLRSGHVSSPATQPPSPIARLSLPSP